MASAKSGIVAGVLGLGAVAGAVTQGETVWDDHGWIRQAEYREDHANVMSSEQAEQIYGLLKDLKVGQQNNRDEWLCDELDEEILSLELELLETQNNSERVAITREIEKAKERWDKTDCQRFEDE